MWRSGNLEYKGKNYIFEIELNEFPIRAGIFGGRIIKLYLYDENEQKIAEYENSTWIIGPEKGTAAYKVVGKILKEHNFRKRGRGYEV